LSGSDSDVACIVDSDCINEGDMAFYSCIDGLCDHKKVFPPIWIEYLGLVALTILMALSTAAGIGGGGIIIPFCMIFFGFDTKSAIALSGCTIVIASFTRFVYNFKQKHPEKKENCVVDYGLAGVMLPTVLIGSMLGVFFNIIFPDPVIIGILTLLLVYLAFNSGQKAK
jgi:uncharacterized membrane protein YfcA